MASVRDYYCAPDLYDVMYSDISDDVAFWVGCARAAAGPVLELACGNGRLLVPCAAAGADIEGLDLTPAMVESLRGKLAAQRLRAAVAVGDMRDFTRPRRYALIFIAFNSFLHNLTQEDQLATLRGCRQHLAPGGRLMISVFHPDARKLIEHDGTPRVIKTLPQPGGGSAKVTDRGRCDPIAQLVQVARQVEMRDAGGGVTETHEMSFELRYVYLPEMELLLTLAGFSRFAVEARTGYTSGFAPKAALENGDPVVWTAWKD